MRDSEFTENDGSVFFHPTEGTHWVVYKNDFFKFYSMSTTESFNRFYH